MSGEITTLSSDHNLYYYAIGSEVPDDACKQFTSETGFRGTDISAMWRIKVLTQLFGPAGIGWYSEVVRYWENHDYGEHEDRVFCDLALYVLDPHTGEWSRPIYGTGGNRMWTWRWKDNAHTEKVWLPNDDCYKMAETDAFGSACKKLGIGGKVYWSQDKSKYTMLEDGTVEARTMTSREAKAEEFRKQESARLASNGGRVETPEERQADAVVDAMGADAVFVDAQAIAEAAKARRDSVNVKDARIAISKTLIADPDNQIIKGYRERFGRYISKWEESKVIDCYLDLQTEGSE